MAPFGAGSDACLFQTPKVTVPDWPLAGDDCHRIRLSGGSGRGRGGDAPRRRESFKYDREVDTPSSVHHVGLAVEDLDGALDTYERLFGARVEQREVVQEQGVEAAFICVGESRLELLGALGEDTPVGRFLAKRGPGMHHVAYEVDDIREALAHLSEAGAELIDESPRRGMFGLEVAFVHPDSVHGVLSEVVAVV